MLSIKNNFLFIHYPKTGGNSIQEILKYYSEDEIVCINSLQDGVERFEVRNKNPSIHKHSTLKNYQAILDDKTFSSLYKFSTIRNPWERMISFFFSPHREITSWNKEQFILLVNEVSTLRDFLGISKTTKSLDLEVDALLRFEELDKDFQKICNKIDVKYEPLLKRNSSIRKHYSCYYDDELKNLVEVKFNEEIKLGNYSFETP